MLCPTVRAKWRALVVSDDEWQPHLDPQRPAQPGEAGGLFVRSSSTGEIAYLKPLKSDAGRSRAAYEKIASDLAVEANANVPPAVLFRRPNAQGQEPITVALSLVFAPQYWPWGDLFGMGSPDGDFSKPGLRNIVGAMLSRSADVVALDAWLDNKDRNNARNVVLACAEDWPGDFYYLDFANSMGFDGQWSNGKHLQFNKLSVPPFFATCLSRVRIRAAAERILSLPDELIASLVGRVPEDFLKDDKRQWLARCLIERKGKLLDDFDQWYPGH